MFIITKMLLKVSIDAAVADMETAITGKEASEQAAHIL